MYYSIGGPAETPRRRPFCPCTALNKARGTWLYTSIQKSVRYLGVLAEIKDLSHLGRSHRTLLKPRNTKENQAKRTSRQPPGGPGAPKRPPRRPPELPGAPREASEGVPGAPKSTPGGSRESPRALQELPGSSQERFESAPSVPKSTPRA